MSDTDLRSKLIRLAHTHPEFRDDILPLLKSADQNAPSNWYGLEPKTPGITEPALLPKTARVPSKNDSMRRLHELRKEHGESTKAYYEAAIQEVKAGGIAPAAVVGGGYKDGKAIAIRWLTEQMQGAKTASKTARLMPRQEAILKAYLQQAGSRAVLDYDSLPSNVREALMRVKDQETLWSDVERWLGDNRQMPADRFDRWAKAAGHDTYEDYVRDWKKFQYPVDVKGEVLPKERWEKLMGKGEKKAAWENLPNGWTSDSVQSMWDTMTDGVKHKITKCMEKMDGKVDDTGAFCGSLAAQVGYKRASNKAGDASLFRKAIIRVAHENPNLRTTLLPCITRRA